MFATSSVSYFLTIASEVNTKNAREGRIDQLTLLLARLSQLEGSHVHKCLKIKPRSKKVCTKNFLWAILVYS